jgi:acetyl-CoA carboxylase carboxyltransferase component
MSDVVAVPNHQGLGAAWCVLVVGSRCCLFLHLDSAFKTAQAIKDMNGEQLPLFILANWRGFSGGMRDMYDEVRRLRVIGC